MELRKREDRIGIYLVRLLKDNVIFDELSYDFLDKAGLTDILKDVPVPIMKKHLNNISTVTLGEGMAFVMGADPNFKHVDRYMEYINKMLGDDFIKYLINEGIETASANDFDYACILFRAALLLAPDNGMLFTVMEEPVRIPMNWEKKRITLPGTKPRPWRPLNL